MPALVVEQADVATGPTRTLPPSMVERMTLILDQFATHRTWLSLDQIARSTSLPRSTAHRILDQLVRLDWLEHGTGGYGLGRRALVLGSGPREEVDLRAAAAPYLHDLLLRTGAVVHLAVLDGARVRYLDKLGGPFAAAVPSRVGGSAPAHCTGLGKAMLAWLEPERVEELVGEEPRVRTSATISGLGALHGELRRIRSRGGLAVERGECFPGIGCLASAIRGPQGPVGALSVVATVGTALERVAPLVRDAARQIAEDLYPDLGPTSGRLHVTGG